jgi:hypothetical protein
MGIRAKGLGRKEGVREFSDKVSVLQNKKSSGDVFHNNVIILNTNEYAFLSV